MALNQVAVETQLLQDMEPRSRPSRGFISIADPLEPCYVKLFPGAAALGSEQMTAVFQGAMRISRNWFTLQACVMIDGMKLSDWRPLYLFYGVTDIWSGVCYFPMMGKSGTTFGGIHSLTIRCYE